MAKNPTFVKNFRSVMDAQLAVSTIIAARKSGYSNNAILDIDFFKPLFSEEYLNTVKSRRILEIRLKNIARDLRVMSKEDLDIRWHDAKDYFDALKRT